MYILHLKFFILCNKQNIKNILLFILKLYKHYYQVHGLVDKISFALEEKLFYIDSFPKVRGLTNSKIQVILQVKNTSSSNNYFTH